jgi:two-component system phosphate regulon sensor histidine kinase PhoR
MPGFWLRSLSTPAFLALLSLALWAAAGAVAALIFFCTALLLQLFFYLRHLAAFATWLAHPGKKPLPDGSGIWGDLFSLLHQRQRHQSSSETSLSTMLERFQRAAEAMPDGIVMLNERDQIEWCNPVAEAQLGLNLERDRGQWLSYLLRQAQFSDYLAAHNYSEPLVIKSLRKRDLTLSIQMVPFGDDQKLLLIRDITQIERVETMRRDFVANVSHELRTPLTVVGGFLETLLDVEESGAAPPDTAQMRRYLGLMLEQTTRMQRLVEDLLTLSRLESSQGSPEGMVDVPRLLESLHREALTLSDGRHRVRLDLRCETGLRGNMDELHSAFGNLVSNAIRYTPEEGEITLSWEPHPEGVAFTVHDTGLGIDPQHIPRLTERFYRVDRGRSRETGGTGLGLAIVKHILTRHHGRLEIDSVPGEGSIFRAVFPAQAY